MPILEGQGRKGQNQVNALQVFETALLYWSTAKQVLYEIKFVLWQMFIHTQEHSCCVICTRNS